MNVIEFLKSKQFVKQLLIAFVGLLIFIFVIMKWLQITTNHSQKIEVPNLDKMQLEEVERKLTALDLKYIVLDSANFNPDYPKKSVISQSPDAGDFVKENRKIYLTLNPSGYKNIALPNVLGRTKRQATSELTAIGFKISSNFILVSDIAKDVVRGIQFNGKNVNVGDKIPQNSVLTLKLGDGLGAGRYNSSIQENIE
jgi:beta-lactam-binding protein with PASTA domain